MKLSRRTFLTLFGAGVASFGFAGYAFGYEPMVDLRVTRYRVTPPNWPGSLKLRIGILADLHACDPWMMPDRIASIVAHANALKPDIFLLLGDYVRAIRAAESLPEDVWAAELARLDAPLGVHAVLGNHDWWQDSEAQKRRGGPTRAGTALKKAGIAVYENTAMRLEKDGMPFWLTGLADQLALLDGWPGDRRQHTGLDDLPGTLAQVTDDAPVIMMAHEPDVFARTPDRVALTLSGHTHGGQVRFFGYSPVVPSAFGNRYAYGLVRQSERDLIVSGGLGCSGLPVRFGVTPEIDLIELGGSV